MTYCYLVDTYYVDQDGKTHHALGLYSERNPSITETMFPKGIDMRKIEQQVLLVAEGRDFGEARKRLQEQLAKL